MNSYNEAANRKVEEGGGEVIIGQREVDAWELISIGMTEKGRHRGGPR